MEIIKTKTKVSTKFILEMRKLSKDKIKGKIVKYYIKKFGKKPTWK